MLVYNNFVEKTPGATGTVCREIFKLSAVFGVYLDLYINNMI